MIKDTQDGGDIVPKFVQLSSIIVRLYSLQYTTLNINDTTTCILCNHKQLAMNAVSIVVLNSDFQSEEGPSFLKGLNHKAEQPICGTVVTSIK